jgi:hypothetical protein
MVRFLTAAKNHRFHRFSGTPERRSETVYETAYIASIKGWFGGIFKKCLGVG